MTKNSTILRGGYDKGYKNFIADKNLFVKPPFFKIRKNLKPSFFGLQAWFPRNETLIQ